VSFCAIGVYHPKTEVNVGTLWRSAHSLGAAYIFTVGRRYAPQPSDTTRAWKHIPLLNFDSLESFRSHLPYSCEIVGVELDARATPLARFRHPVRACYLLGAEDHGLPESVRSACHRLVQLRGDHCLNVAVAGSIVLHDRLERT
jgi:tRNA G18 (ribose-2'-O)-methylase SpoU